MPLTKEEKRAKAPWRIEQSTLTWWFTVLRINSEGGTAAYLGYYETEAAAIYAIAKTQGE